MEIPKYIYKTCVRQTVDMILGPQRLKYLPLVTSLGVTFKSSISTTMINGNGLNMSQILVIKSIQTTTLP